MLQLLPYQINHSKDIIRPLTSLNRAALDASDAGTGKTYVSCYTVAYIGCPCVIVTNKATKPSWEKVSAGFGLKPILITNYESLRRGKYPECRKSGNGFVWNLPQDTTIIFDECQRCKSRTSLNAKLLIAARAQHYRLILCSATAANSPLEMYALGYALGLHQLWNFWTWARRNGVTQGFFGMEFTGGKEALRKLHNDIFPARGSRMRISEIPDFPSSVVTAEVIDTGKAKAIQREYDRLRNELRRAEHSGNREQLQAVANELGSKRASHLTLVLRARQAIELYKVPAMVEMTRAALEEGQSVVLLVNFSATIEALMEQLDCPHVIRGGQSPAERQQVIDRFQSNEIHVVIANIQAGGVGVSLHDPEGQRSRLSIISPTFSAADLRQALGRVHRAGGAASIQKICFAAGTCEEHTAKICAAKLAQIDLLNDGDMQPFPIQ